ncbi:MAG: hypothetical protein ACREV4_08715 [Gammaproteobacteria bacterium]
MKRSISACSRLKLDRDGVRAAQEIYREPICFDFVALRDQGIHATVTGMPEAQVPQLMGEGSVLPVREELHRLAECLGITRLGTHFCPQPKIVKRDPVLAPEALHEVQLCGQ